MDTQRSNLNCHDNAILGPTFMSRETSGEIRTTTFNLVSETVCMYQPRIASPHLWLNPENVRYKVIGVEMKGMESSMKLVALGATQRRG